MKIKSITLSQVTKFEYTIHACEKLLDVVYLLWCIDFLFAVYLLSYNTFTCKFFQTPLYSLAIRSIIILIYYKYYIIILYNTKINNVLFVCAHFGEMTTFGKFLFPREYRKILSRKILRN